MSDSASQQLAVGDSLPTFWLILNQSTNEVYSVDKGWRSIPELRESKEKCQCFMESRDEANKHYRTARKDRSEAKIQRYDLDSKI